MNRRNFLQITGAAIAWGDVGGRIIGAEPLETKNLRESSLIRSVRRLGNQFVPNPVDVTGTDGATSTQLPNGDSLWLFGDTVEGPFNTIRGMPLGKMLSNVGAIVSKQTATDGIRHFKFLATPDGKRPRQLVPFLPQEDPNIHRVWPVHGVCDGQHVYVFYHRISLLDGVDVFLNFQLDGMGVARAKLGEFEFERLIAPDGTHEFWKGDQPSYGVFVERAKDYVYVWGSLMTGMYLARTRAHSLADRSSYEYLVEAPTADTPDVKPRWDSKFSPATALFDSVPNEMSAAYNPYLKKFMAFHSLHREHKIVVRTSPNRWGPWSAPEIAYRPKRIDDNDLVYAAKEHPELARDGGRVIYVSFVNSATYIPQLVELTLR